MQGSNIKYKWCIGCSFSYYIFTEIRYLSKEYRSDWHTLHFCNSACKASYVVGKSALSVFLVSFSHVSTSSISSSHSCHCRRISSNRLQWASRRPNNSYQCCWSWAILTLTSSLAVMSARGTKNFPCSWTRRNVSSCSLNSFCVC